MDNINLLPEDLRGQEKEKTGSTKEEFHYTDPKKQFGIPEAEVKKPVKQSWWKKIFSGSKNKNKQDKVVLKDNKKEALPVNGEMKGMHLPVNGDKDDVKMSTPELEVDLAADKTIMFSWTEFYYRIKVGVIALILVLIVLLGLYLLIFKLSSPLQESEATVRKETAEIKTQLAEFEKDKENIVVLDRRLKNINQLLSGHLFWTKLFTLLENNTLDSVSYTNLNVDESGKVVLSSLADNYMELAKQISIWQNQEEVSSVEFSQAALVEVRNLPDSDNPEGSRSAVSFDLFLTLSPKFLAAYE